MDDLDLTGLRTKAATAGTDLANLTSSSPGMLADLRSSLASVFAKDNPLIQARDQALSTFLSTPSTTRAQLLPQNLPQVEGSFLNLSPTQQASIVSSRNAAALAPLLGLNQAVTAGYGSIGDIVSGTGTGLQALVNAEGIRTNQAQKAFENALAQSQEERIASNAGGGSGLSLGNIADLINSFTQGQQIGNNRPDISTFDEPEAEAQRGSLPQQVQALPQAGFTFGLPTGIRGPGGLGERVKAWGDLIWKGLTGN